VAVALTLYVYSDALIGQLYRETLTESAVRQAQLLAAHLPWDESGAAMDRHCAELATVLGARLTVIGGDGTVLGDSAGESALMENQIDRPEVAAALRSGTGLGLRAGDPAGTLYLAWRQTREPQRRIIRLGLSMAPVEAARDRIRAAIWTGLGVAVLLSIGPTLLLARRLSRRLTAMAEFSNAVAAGRHAPRLLVGSDDVIGRLEVNLVAMAESLKAQLEAARQEKGKLEVTLSGMVEGVLVVDRAGVIQLSNQRAARLFGAPQPLSGRPLIEVSRDPDLHELLRAAMQEEAGAAVVREIVLDAAQRQTLRVTVSPIPAADSVPAQFILVFHDITELKKLEATRRDFVANVSHELRTPLTAIRGYAETLLNGAIDNPDVSRKFVAVIERHSERLTRLTEDLLTLSDLELGRAALQRDSIALAPAVDGALDVVREKAEQRQIELRRELADDLPAVLADADRIEQVLVNLLDNAVKYTPPGGRVTIRARPANEAPPASLPHGAKPVSWVEIQVVDTGTGIPSQDLPRLTERFYRVDKARSRELGGTGLGLAIVKHIVQAHGGALRIDSELGRGTCVSVYLPVEDEAPGDVESAT
jgi:two-component system phosphate regulon sensor histidine kinase PhoR